MGFSYTITKDQSLVEYQDMHNYRYAISVIVPSYKPGDYIYKCLDSLVNQDYDHQQYEVLIILNGCNEPYYSRLEKYIQEKSEFIFRLIQTDIPGVSNARNIGIDSAKGEYITFIDDDDYVSASFLRLLYGVSSAQMVGISNEKVFDERDGLIKEDSISREYGKKASMGIQSYCTIRKIFSGPWIKLIHRNIIASSRFDVNFSNGEDSLFMFEISKRMGPVCFTPPEAVYYRRIRSGSAMSKEKKVWFTIKNRIRLIKEFSVLFFKEPKSYSFLFFVTRVLGCLHSILNAIKKRL